VKVGTSKHQVRSSDRYVRPNKAMKRRFKSISAIDEVVTSGIEREYCPVQGQRRLGKQTWFGTTRLRPAANGHQLAFGSGPRPTFGGVSHGAAASSGGLDDRSKWLTVPTGFRIVLCVARGVTGQV
jgi:hypothetical protein